MLGKALLLVGFAASNLLASVCWDGYTFRVDDGMASLTYGSDCLFVCDRREVVIIDDRLVVRNCARPVDIAIGGAAAAAICDEFRRDAECQPPRRREPFVHWEPQRPPPWGSRPRWEPQPWRPQPRPEVWRRPAPRPTGMGTSIHPGPVIQRRAMQTVNRADVPGPEPRDD